MTVNYKTGTFTTPTGTGAQDVVITGVGFTPKAIIIYSSQNTALDTIQTNQVVMIGFSDGTTDKCTWMNSQDAVSVSKSNRYADSDAIIQARSATTGGALDRATLKTFDANGFTLAYSVKASTSAINYHYIAFAGDIEVEVGSFLGATSTGTQNVSTGIASADFVMLMGSVLAVEDTSSTTAIGALGMASSSSNQGQVAINSKDNVSTSITDRFQSTDSIYAALDGSGSILDEADFTGFTSSGFNLNWSTAAGVARYVYYLTIKGGKWEVGNGTTPTSVSTKAYTTTFQPKGLGLFGNIQFGGTTTVSVQSFYHLGAADDTNNVSIAVVDRDAISTTDSGRVSSSTKCFQNMSVTSATRQEADLHSFNATDYTLNFTKVDGDAREFIWFVVGDEPVVEDGGGAGPAGSSKQVGVSLVDKQIRDTVPPKKKRLLESQFVLDATLVEKVEIPTRVHSTLKALCADSELTLSGEAQATLKTSMSISSFPLANLSARLEATGKAQEKLTTKIETDGEPDYSNLDRIIQMAKLLED